MRIPSGNDRSSPLSGYDEAAAEYDGWSLGKGPDQGVLIRRETRFSGPAFSSDEEMRHHILQKAWDGSAVHEAAILALVRHDPEGEVQKAYVSASVSFLKKRAAEARERSDPDHKVAVAMRMSGPDADRVRSGWSEVAAHVISRMTPNPGESARSAATRTADALRFAKDAYLVMIAKTSDIGTAISEIVRQSDVVSFVQPEEGPSPSL